MILRHATTRRNLDAIHAAGLRTACADPTAKIQGVWLHSPSKSAWAVVHTMRKHGVALDDVVVIEVRVNRRGLRRFRLGLWVSAQDIGPDALGNITAGAAFGASATE